MTMLIVEQVSFGGWRHHLARWEACHWILSRLTAPYSTAITDSLDSQVASAPLRIQFAGVTPVPLPPPALLGALWVLSSCGNGDYDSNGYNGVCRRQAAHILIAEGDTTPSEPFEPSCPKGVSMPSRRLVFITDCLKCGMYRDSSPAAQNDCVRREIP